jgi:TetR/AcrR family acrAB operon transcriptional repressor
MYIKSMKRAPEEALQTREKLLDSAMAVFLEKGYSDARIDDIAKAAGMTRGAFYHHFKGKKEIYYALVNERNQPAMSIILRIQADDREVSLEQLKQFITDYLQLLASDRRFKEANELTVLKTAFVPELKEGMEAKKAGMHSLLDWLDGRITLLIEKGDLSPSLDARKAGFALYAALFGTVSMWLIDPSLFPLLEQSDALAETILKVLE